MHDYEWELGVKEKKKRDGLYMYSGTLVYPSLNYIQSFKLLIQQSTVFLINAHHACAYDSICVYSRREN